ncbi:MAG: hypothetical protein QM831_24410 [Kofleriaceae bacterium]
MRAVIVTGLLGGLLSGVAHADSAVTVQLSPQGQALAAQAGISESDLAGRIKDQVDLAYDTAHVDKFLRSFGDATSFAQRGLGVDYMSLPGSFMLGFGAQVGVSSTDELSLDQRPTSGGAAANLSVMIGYNLKDAGHPRWTLFANGFYENGSTDRLEGNIATGGFHVQVKLVEPQEDKGLSADVIRWGGIDLTTGVEFTRWSFGVKDTISQNFTVDGINDSIDMNSTGKFDLTSTAGTIPIELTTGMRIALLVSLYAGVGFDITGGKSSVDADLTGTLTTHSDNTNIGTVHVTESGNNTSSPGQFRGLAGVQVNLWKLKVYTQANVSQLPAASIGFGLRLVL